MRGGRMSREDGRGCGGRCKPCSPRMRRTRLAHAGSGTSQRSTRWSSGWATTPRRRSIVRAAGGASPWPLLGGGTGSPRDCAKTPNHLGEVRPRSSRSAPPKTEVLTDRAGIDGRREVEGRSKVEVEGRPEGAAPPSSSQAGRTRTKPAKVAPTGPGQAKSFQVGPSPTNPYQVGPRSVRPSRTKPGTTNPSQVGPSKAKSGRPTSGRGGSGQTWPRQAGPDLNIAVPPLPPRLASPTPTPTPTSAAPHAPTTIPTPTPTPSPSCPYYSGSFYTYYSYCSCNCFNYCHSCSYSYCCYLTIIHGATIPLFARTLW